ncbi:MAG: chain-length determining protein [Prevotella sp.]|nr:chain-length determining protein [Prevotella sp.]MBR0389264.1 chain-length determining protein [Prevotella sp.]
MNDERYIENLEEESSIDFMKIFQDLLKHKMLYAKVLPIAFVLAAIYALAQPNYYNCTVKLSPEMSGSKSTSGLASLASSFGVNLGSGGAGTEALFPTLYPDLMNSVDFKTSLFHVPVTIEGNKEKGEKDRTMSYYDYLSKEQKSPWWSQGIKAIMSMFNGQSSMVNEKVNKFRLTREQAGIVKVIDKNVVCDVDKKTMVITINVTDQDPVIAATMADTVKTRLQKFITDYRTSKVRVDLEYNKKIYSETKARYEKARQLYAEFMDHNRDIILQTVRQKQTDLENEMQLQYNAYQQVAAQLLSAEAKVQEETPAFTTLQSATVPVMKAGPKRAQMCLIFVFLAFLGTTGWILYKEDDWKQLVGMD